MAKIRNRKKQVLSLLDRIGQYADAIRTERKSMTDPQQIEIVEKKLTAAERAKWIISGFRGTSEATPYAQIKRQKILKTAVSKAEPELDA